MTNELRATPSTIQAIDIIATAKVPSTKWEKDSSGEPEEVTTVTLVIHNISARDRRRLARAALDNVTLEVELIPRTEQAEFAVEITAEQAAEIERSAELEEDAA